MFPYAVDQVLLFPTTNSPPRGGELGIDPHSDEEIALVPETRHPDLLLELPKGADEITKKDGLLVMAFSLKVPC